MQQPAPLRSRTTLASQLAEGLRRRIMDGEFPPAGRLPSEAALAETYQVSRVTVRSALRKLESQGLIDVRHGSGSFVSDFGSGIRAGLQELRSISETIREMGHEPSMERHRAVRRPAGAADGDKLGIPPDEEVVAIERKILADGIAVAYSYDVVPVEGLSDSVLEHLGEHSVFAGFAEAGIVPARAIAEIHAVQDETVGWGNDRPDPPLYLLLDQIHYDKRGRAIAYSRSYFVEGRFQFVVLRTT